MVPRSIVKWANLLAESGVALRATEGLFVLGIARYIYLCAVVVWSGPRQRSPRQ
jgi:hypothetical protein